MRPGGMRVAWDRIIPQTNLTQDAIEGFASGNNKGPCGPNSRPSGTHGPTMGISLIPSVDGCTPSNPNRPAR